MLVSETRGLPALGGLLRVAHPVAQSARGRRGAVAQSTVQVAQSANGSPQGRLHKALKPIRKKTSWANWATWDTFPHMGEACVVGPGSGVHRHG
jgi:hypothetical protein